MRIKGIGTAFLLTALTLLLDSSATAQFEARGEFFVGQIFPYSLVAGDFNRDGILDVAAVSHEPGGVDILLGKGDGTFKPGATYAVAVQPFYAAAASLRGNGILDLVVGDSLSDSVYVMLGNGDGTFQAPVAYSTTAESTMVGVGVFTSSGRVDIIDLERSNTQGVYCGCVEVLPGNGDGTFGVPITTPLPNLSGIAIASGDFNDDGNLDVAVSGEFFSGEVEILLGNGDGTFTADGVYTVSSEPQSIATSYFTGDKKKLDLAVANEEGYNLSVLLGNGDGTFQQPVSYATEYPTWVIARDLDGDGKVDLAASNAGAFGRPPVLPGVSILKGNGDGTFQSGTFYPAGNKDNLSYVAAGDFNRDGKTDLVLVDEDADQIITLLNTGVVTFTPTTPLNFTKQAVGTTSSPQTVSLTNTGSTALTISSMKASTEFGVTSTCGKSVAAGGNCTISVTFSPTKQGAAQGTISIVDSASTKPQVIELFGTGT